MAEFLSPGVYVLEESSGSKPITGVSTSTGAFVGIAERGPVNKPQFVSSFTQYTTLFGGFDTDGVLPLGVYQFFAEGGARCYVTRVAGAGAVSAKVDLKAGTKVVGTVTASSPGAWANEYQISVKTGSVTGTFRLTLLKYLKKVDGKEVYGTVETFDNLTNENAESTVNGSSNYITYTVASGASGIPANTDVNAALAGGADDLDDTGKTGSLLKGTKENKTGIYSFDVVDDVNILAIPDAAFQNDGSALADVSKEALTYCQNRGDLFFIGDTACGQTIENVKSHKAGLLSSFGALYYPWIYINHPSTGKKMLMPPSGAMAGIYANTDIKIGVHKAPAGLATGTLSTARGVEKVVTKGEHDVLNPIGVNVIRSFKESGIVVWGARTATSDSEWKYINVRRLFLYIEESIDEGTQWVVFEPNTPVLWGQVKRNLTAFLTGLWRQGALFGSTPEEAFYVKVDEENNPQSERDAGRLNIEVGVAPVKPAEFVVIRISQKVETE